MVERRDLVGGGLLTGLAALFMPRSANAAAAAPEHDDRAIANAIDRLRDEFVKSQECGPGPCGAIASIRNQLSVFLKANQKYPDFIDAGVDVWTAVYDWHLRHNQPINATRLPDGRYGLTFMFTTVVLRPDNQPSFLSYGYDAR
jgi:hypothetical protein